MVGSTGSTNADLAARARAGAAEGTALIAGEQTAGRGRLGRIWESPPGSSVSVSLLLRPMVTAPEGASWLPLLAALGVRAGIEAATGVPVALKWPNDVVVIAGPRPGKVCGLLVESVGDADRPAVVVGFGINTRMTDSQLPVPEATSLSLAAGVPPDAAALAVTCLSEVAARYGRWSQAAGDAERSGLVQEYRQHCVTLGREVVVHLPDGTDLTGPATGIDQRGHLLVATDDGPRTIAAGDVVHVR